MPTVNVPGVGNVRFPDTLSPDEIKSQVNRMIAQQKANAVRQNLVRSGAFPGLHVVQSPTGQLRLSQGTAIRSAPQKSWMDTAGDAFENIGKTLGAAGTKADNMMTSALLQSGLASNGARAAYQRLRAQYPADARGDIQAQQAFHPDFWSNVVPGAYHNATNLPYGVGGLIRGLAPLVTPGSALTMGALGAAGKLSKLPDLYYAISGAAGGAHSLYNYQMTGDPNELTYGALNAAMGLDGMKRATFPNLTFLPNHIDSPMPGPQNQPHNPFDIGDYSRKPSDVIQPRRNPANNGRNSVIPDVAKSYLANTIRTVLPVILGNRNSSAAPNLFADNLFQPAAMSGNSHNPDLFSSQQDAQTAQPTTDTFEPTHLMHGGQQPLPVRLLRTYRGLATIIHENGKLGKIPNALLDPIRKPDAPQSQSAAPPPAQFPQQSAAVGGSANPDPQTQMALDLFNQNPTAPSQLAMSFPDASFAVPAASPSDNSVQQTTTSAPANSAPLKDGDWAMAPDGTRHYIDKINVPQQGSAITRSELTGKLAVSRMDSLKQIPFEATHKMIEGAPVPPVRVTRPNEGFSQIVHANGNIGIVPNGWLEALPKQPTPDVTAMPLPQQPLTGAPRPKKAPQTAATPSLFDLLTSGISPNSTSQPAPSQPSAASTSTTTPQQVIASQATSPVAPFAAPVDTNMPQTAFSFPSDTANSGNVDKQSSANGPIDSRISGSTAPTVAADAPNAARRSQDPKSTSSDGSTGPNGTTGKRTKATASKPDRFKMDPFTTNLLRQKTKQQQGGVGNEAELAFRNWLEQQGMKLHPKPNSSSHGPDAIYVGGTHLGWDWAELKPNTPTGRRDGGTLLRKRYREGAQGNGVLYVYNVDAAGNYSFRIHTPRKPRP